MSRRSPLPPRAAAKAKSHADDGDSTRGAASNTPFSGLRKQLRTHQDPPQASAPRTAAGKKIRPSSKSADTDGFDHAAPPDEADLELFRKMAGPTQPIRKGVRAELERPRPAPVPRPRSKDETDEATDKAALPPKRDTLSLAYEGVQPLRDTGRVELDTPLRHGARLRGPSNPPRAQRPDALVLPADIDQTDPASLFRSVVGEAQPIDTRNRVELNRPTPRPAPIKREEDERAALDESLAAPLTFEDRLDMGDEAAFLRPGLPRRVLTDLRRGRWVLQGQIDLHGLIRDEARSALAHFLHDSLLQGKRCIRVIHGKGHGSPGKVSILKQLSRGWLAQREEILAFCQAGPHDGGAGALLVLLRAQNAAQR